MENFIVKISKNINFLVMKYSFENNTMKFTNHKTFNNTYRYLSALYIHGNYLAFTDTAPSIKCNLHKKYLLYSI